MIPTNLVCGRRVAHVKLDEAYGTTFSLSWHTYGGKDDSMFWKVGVYSSASNRWTMCEEFGRPADRDPHVGSALVYNGLLFGMHSTGPTHCYCGWYSFDSGKFVRAGQAIFPPMVIGQMEQENVYSGAGWEFVEHLGIVYVVASIQGILSKCTHGFGIWELDLAHFKFERVVVTPLPQIVHLGFTPADA